MSPLKVLSRYSPYVPRMAEVLEVERMTESVNRLVIAPTDKGGFRHKPGQFVMLSLPAVGEAPFSISRAEPDSGTFEVAIHRCGLVTEALHRLQAGDRVSFRGPYGTAFPLEEFAGHDVLLLGGGLGYIPLRSLLFPVLENRADYGRLIVLAGFRCMDDAIFTEELNELAARDDVEVLRSLDADEEGFADHCGVVTDLVAQTRPKPDSTIVAIVGPPVMMPFAVSACRELRIPDKHIFVSLERRMHCGVGKCGHCQINSLNICVDGPVFRLPALKSMPEAREVLV